MSYENDDDQRRENHRRDDEAAEGMRNASEKRQRDLDNSWKRAKQYDRDRDLTGVRGSLGMGFESEQHSKVTVELTPEEMERHAQMVQSKMHLVSQIRELKYLPEADKHRWIAGLTDFDPASSLAAATLQQHWQKLTELQKAQQDNSRPPLSELFRPLS